MNAVREYFAGFDLGEFLGVGLDTRQIGYLAAALFLGLFGLSALRRVTRTGGPLPVVWIAVAVGLFAGAFLVAASGFPDQIPDELQPWADPDRLLRAAAVLASLGCAAVLLSAYWVRRLPARLACRLAGLAVAGGAIWLAAGWFGDQLPEEARPWAARTVVTRLFTVAGLGILAATFWFRPVDEAPPIRWASRTVVGPALGIAVALAAGWFGPIIWPELPIREVVRGTVVIAAVATGTCVVIAGGAYLLRDRARPERMRPMPMNSAGRSLAPDPRPLPVALLVDEHGRPVLPARPPQGAP